MSPEDVGRRVVVRRVLPGAGDPGHSGPRYSDVLGELLAADDHRLVVRRADGRQVQIAVADVAAAKPVPPAPPRRPTIAELERIAAQGWQGLEQEHLGGWLLRAGAGFTGRANSVLPLAPPDSDVGAALATVLRWYAARGLPPVFQVPLPLAADLDARLAVEGWRAYNATAVLTGSLTALRERAGRRPDLPPAQHEAVPGPRWLAGYEYRGAELPAGARAVLTRATTATFASVRDGDRQLAVARGVVDEGWLGITAVTVTAAARRRGVGEHLMRELADWATANGADRAYLQVAEDNAPALAFYEALGFRRHHGYHYRVLDPAGGTVAGDRPAEDGTAARP